MTPVLYIKSGCPWCNQALDYFKQQGLELDIREVRSNKPFMEQMKKLSGQSKAPTFVYGDFIVADFDVQEFQLAVSKAPAVKQQLGLR